MPDVEVLVFIIAALLAGGLSMGGITLVYFADKWREEGAEGSSAVGQAPREMPRLDRVR